MEPGVCAGSFGSYGVVGGMSGFSLKCCKLNPLARFMFTIEIFSRLWSISAFSVVQLKRTRTLSCQSA